MADDLGVDVKDVMEMEMRLTSRDATFDAPVDETSPSLFLKSNELLPDEIIEKNEKNLLTNKLYTVVKIR